MNRHFLFLICYSFALLWSGPSYGQEPLIPDSVQNLNNNFHFQLTSVSQFKSAMKAPYSGENSLAPGAERASTLTATIFLTGRLWRNGAWYINPEVAGGGGVSQARGIAGFTNGEAFRVGQPAPSFYLARMFLQHTFSLSEREKPIGENANETYKTKAVKYLDVVVGKFSIADYFDRNSYSHDPRSQFLNWSLMSNGAWDYAANVRGYTVGSVIEFGSEQFAFRAAAVLVPTEANGNDLNFRFSNARSWVMEAERTFRLVGRNTIVRVLAFHTTANMGNYRLALAATDGPDVVATRMYGRTKYGFGINAEHELGKGVGMFARASWNDGKNETWAFTEIDRSLSAGLQFEGGRWKRPKDRFGVGMALNGISSDHRDYLGAGGLGFIIGDGRLRYGNEFITEVYYNANLFSETFFLTPNVQFVNNPAYNRDRGPAFLAAVRVHVEF